ncbi:hypothetical protein LPTSP3_g34690 [Leptospira kobayashii]|uniref:DUF6285 domain-containing protein n=1 Tax=Leptospira kobayashii TaxID=1917830 RepID=A0ABN6KH07_9LEPT|nr:DUF6285 domain-containing protein [Leptospira kobayashii]BDA80539.1 hypothetical protein LPTSP3_g34690 [Leptospira kobayashii]
MQYRPEAKELLSTIQDLLIKEILPKIEADELLSYKTLVSWNMLGVIIRESEKEDEQSQEEFQSLLKLSSILKDINLTTDQFKALPRKEKLSRLKDWNSLLAKQLRETKNAEVGSEIWNQIKLGLKNNLSVSNPRFNV